MRCVLKMVELTKRQEADLEMLIFTLGVTKMDRIGNVDIIRGISQVERRDSGCTGC